MSGRQKPFGNFKRSKYKSVKVEVDGKTFDSKKEAARWSELRLLEMAGKIEGLRCQPKLPCRVNGVLVCNYIGDFAYRESGKLVVEDVKSAYTAKLPLYRLKNKLVKAVHGVDIREVK